MKEFCFAISTPERVRMNLPQGREPAFELAMFRNKEVLMSNGNSLALAETIESGWALVERSTGRFAKIFNKPEHEEKARKFEDGYKVDYYGYCYLMKFCEESFVATYHEGEEIKICFSDDLQQVLSVERVGALRCETCGAWIKPESRVGVRCWNCLIQGEGIGAILSYHQPSNNCWHIMDESEVDEEKTAIFGVEIERDFVECCGSNEFYTRRNKALKDLAKIFYTEEKLGKKRLPKRAYFCETDGSLTNGGIEWITEPASLSWYKRNAEKFDKAFEALRESGFDSSERSGTHIHINRAFFGEKSKFEACKLAIIFARFWDEFLAICKRENFNCYYCKKPNHKATDDVFELVEKTINDRCEHGVAVNQQHAKTIELRVWGECRSWADLYFEIDVTQSLCRAVKKMTLEDAQRVKFADLFKGLSNKREHLEEAKARLKAKSQARAVEELDAMLKRFETTEKTEEE